MGVCRRGAQMVFPPLRFPVLVGCHLAFAETFVGIRSAVQTVTNEDTSQSSGLKDTSFCCEAALTRLVPFWPNCRSSSCSVPKRI